MSSKWPEVRPMDEAPKDDEQRILVLLRGGEVFRVAWWPDWGDQWFDGRDFINPVGWWELPQIPEELLD